MSLYDDIKNNLNENLHKDGSENYDGNIYNNAVCSLAIDKYKQKNNPQVPPKDSLPKDDGLHHDIDGKEKQKASLREVPLERVDTKTFVDTFKETKALYAEQNPDAWRVSDISVEGFEDDHPGAACYLTPGKSTVAITKDGDIVSVCKHPDDTYKGKEIIASAVAKGGTKLDSYDGNHIFYQKCGFEPVSWCKWKDEFAPDDWKQDINKREDIIFYKYTGKIPVKLTTPKDFKSQTPISADYDDACKIRDNSIK